MTQRAFALFIGPRLQRMLSMPEIERVLVHHHHEIERAGSSLPVTTCARIGRDETALVDVVVDSRYTDQQHQIETNAEYFKKAK